jgi:hypothetical protein
MIQNCFGYDPMIRVPFPALMCGLSTVTALTTGNDIASVNAAARGSLVMMLTGK